MKRTRFYETREGGWIIEGRTAMYRLAGKLLMVGRIQNTECWYTTMWGVRAVLIGNLSKFQRQKVSDSSSPLFLSHRPFLCYKQAKMLHTQILLRIRCVICGAKKIRVAMPTMAINHPFPESPMRNWAQLKLFLDKLKCRPRSDGQAAVFLMPAQFNKIII